MPMPFESTFATATQTLVAGSGNFWSSSTLGIIRYHAGTMANVPKKTPMNWARNCFRGFAPSR